MHTEPTPRDQWSTRCAVAVTTIGSAAGVGNIRRFGRVVDENGGGTSRFACLFALILLASGCATPANRGDAPTLETQAPHHIYVVRHGWHTGIVVRAAEVPADAWPARRDFADAEFLEVGWGDREYYQASDPTIWLGLRALLWPTPGVLHVAAFSGLVERYFAAHAIVELRVAPHGFARLVAAIGTSHELDASGRPIPLGPGLYGTSRFYASREAFHLFRTCNVWTANILREAGVNVEPALSHSAGSLFAQLQPHGRTIRALP